VDFGETDESRALRTAVAEIARDFGPSHYVAHAAERKPCDELWTVLGEAGFIGVNIPVPHTPGVPAPPTSENSPAPRTAPAGQIRSAADHRGPRMVPFWS
jgi:alkylation response protein AidB-like acyl-CoA dehydrogenase